MLTLPVCCLVSLPDLFLLTQMHAAEQKESEVELVCYSCLQEAFLHLYVDCVIVYLKLGEHIYR